ncbi:MAG: DNA-directed RNA polymerase subunit RpoH/Rpb5 C-terminal domain-containing protein [Candidatus Bilamarchaeaceae archaeon]
MKKSEKGKKKVMGELDVLSYWLMPKMEILSEDAKKRVLQRFGIVEDQLPKFKASDPAVRALGAKIGDVIQIERNDTSGKYYAYRVVVEK